MQKKPHSSFCFRLYKRRQLKSVLLATFGLIFSLVFILPAKSEYTLLSKQYSSNYPQSQQSAFLNVNTKLYAFTNAEQVFEQGKKFYQLGQFVQAVQSFQEAAKIYESQADIVNQALVLNYLSLAEQKLGQWNQAIEANNISLNLLNRASSNTGDAKHILALAYNTQGGLLLAQGKAESALESWQNAAKIYTQVGDNVGHMGSLINQTTALQALGLNRRVTKIFTQIEKSLLSTPDSLLKVTGLRSLGNALRTSGDLEKSQKVLELSLAIATKLQSPTEESVTLLSLGNTAFTQAKRYSQLNYKQNLSGALDLVPQHCGFKTVTEKARPFYQKASEYYQKSASKSSSKLPKLQAQLNRLNVLLAFGEQASNEELGLILSDIFSLTGSRAGVYAHVNLAQSLMCFDYAASSKHLAPNQDIVQLLNRAIQQAKELQDLRAQSYALGHLGQVYEFAKQWSTAQQYTESALNLAQTINAPDITYQWEWQLARLLSVQEKQEKAIAAYSAAVKTLKSLRSDLVALNPDIQFDFRDEVEPVYRQLVALLLQPKSSSETEFIKKSLRSEISQENLKRARDVLEALQLAELDNFFRDACITATPVLIDQVADNADPKTAVIYPIILANSIEVIVKLPKTQQLLHYSTYKSQVEVESTLEQLQQKLQQRYTFRDREALSTKVYDWIIKPAEADLTQNQIKTLVFVLDGSLRNIPPAALYDGKQYLIEKYSVALSPGLQLLTISPKRGKFKALIGGLTESRLGFSPLPNVATELQQIQSVVSTKKLLNQTFTESSVENQVSSVSYPIVHLATHGKFSSQIEDTFILAWNGKINIKQLQEVLQNREQVEESNKNVLHQIELLVLSACETAKGDKRAGLGLAGIAVRSGARSTLASLWQVDDKSTSILMSEFYRQLINNPSLTKAEALRLAQQNILHKYQEHPYYWAPYVLIGSWL